MMSRKDKNKYMPNIFSKKQIKKVDEKIELLGDSCKYDAIFFLNMRLISSIILFFVILYVSNWGYIVAPLVVFIYYHLIYYYLIEYNINKRRDKLDVEAMYFFEIMTLALESGNNIKNALVISCDNVDSELSREFRKALDEIDYGKTLNESLDSLKERIPSDNVNNIILSIEQSNVFGNDIIKDMYRQIDYIRDREIQKMKSTISKIPLKVSIVSVIFYIPLIMLLILSPILIRFLG